MSRIRDLAGVGFGVFWHRQFVSNLILCLLEVISLSTDRIIGIGQNFYGFLSVQIFSTVIKWHGWYIKCPEKSSSALNEHKKLGFQRILS